MSADAQNADGPTREPPSTATRLSSSDLVQELRGDLPCIACRYNLRGISVRDYCPECGTAVRATILAKIDPYAPAFRPLRLPRVTGVAVIAWCVSPLVAVAATWMLRSRDLLGPAAEGLPAARTLALVGTVAVAVTGLASIALVNPHRGIARRSTQLAAMGVVATLASALVYWHIHGVIDAERAAPFVDIERADPLRAAWRIVFGLLAAGAIAGLRPNARLLAARSMVLRMGRVDRQTLLALVAALGVAGVGDVLHVVAGLGRFGTLAPALIGVGTLLVVLGSALFTIGLIGVAIDGWRIVPVIFRPPLGMTQLVGVRGERARGSVPP